MFRDQRYVSPTMCFESKTHVMMQRGMETISSEHCKHLEKTHLDSYRFSSTNKEQCFIDPQQREMR